MAQLAIKGHKIRGKEVIEIFEMLGGKISCECGYEDGLDPHYVYFINTNENSFIDGFLLGDKNLIDFSIFTLEEFLEKFPYKVGDKVQHKGATSCGTVYEVEKMRWVYNHVEYIVKRLWYNNCHSVVTAQDLQPYKE